MEKLNIICVDDQREVLSAVLKDLAPLNDFFNVEDCESADEALELMDDLDAEGEFIALVISDHVMPGKIGVELLTEISQDARFVHTKKVLLTGQATHQDTIEAINLARIESYFEKPWKAEQLLTSARTLITEYIFDMGLDYQPWNEILDNSVVYRRLR
ncbi:Hydrogenase transcriptional regulatory protein hupR1 [Photobacterium damselae subsp. piscicida]|uniref:Hydrogenase transcriptional regulatory protein hupR1 n=1 Tax=Photobacterium damsela subsp. piscicida TaxID=38294 RepID=A0A1V1V4F1_PHODP|nr:response regulator [Photobacterium damselae]MBE8128860.1 response regulator [Photobacterium damselae subsp. piscicida]MDP2514686.1 response regulator [Photobacterium damselae subsp. piscicida]MDP2532425.1 response regulator [Photobacterium damselae subsp. piscicida]MDP2544906.1 response regulator [Photobacterium damselae subsp. piscicida]MDP2569273.1 response regulator [Photobacterium damselae subsp. piscicida]